MLSKQFFAFDTLVDISANCTQEVLDQTLELCAFYENMFSRTIKTSEVSRLNGACGVPTKVSEDTAALIKTALSYCNLSGGLFDITVGSVSKLWDFKREHIPTASSITQALAHVDYTKVQVIDSNTVVINDPAMSIDLGGIAKGFIADKLALHLQQGGATSAIINLGGNVFVLGHKETGEKWTVGIADADGLRSDLLAAVQVENSSVVTSGAYERSFVLDGRVYHHILDPKTGYPADLKSKSATVISRYSLDGDGLSTTLLLKEPADAIALIESLDGVEAVIFDCDDELHTSSGIGQSIAYIDIKHPERSLC